MYFTVIGITIALMFGTDRTYGPNQQNDNWTAIGILITVFSVFTW